MKTCMNLMTNHIGVCFKFSFFPVCTGWNWGRVMNIFSSQSFQALFLHIIQCIVTQQYMRTVYVPCLLRVEVVVFFLASASFFLVFLLL